MLVFIVLVLAALAFAAPTPPRQGHVDLLPTKLVEENPLFTNRFCMAWTVEHRPNGVIAPQGPEESWHEQDLPAFYILKSVAVTDGSKCVAGWRIYSTYDPKEKTWTQMPVCPRAHIRVSKRHKNPVADLHVPENGYEGIGDPHRWIYGEREDPELDQDLPPHWQNHDGMGDPRFWKNGTHGTELDSIEIFGHHGHRTSANMYCQDWSIKRLYHKEHGHLYYYGDVTPACLHWAEWDFDGNYHWDLYEVRTADYHECQDWQIHYFFSWKHKHTLTPYCADSDETIQKWWSDHGGYENVMKGFGKHYVDK